VVWRWRLPRCFVGEGISSGVGRVWLGGCGEGGKRRRRTHDCGEVVIIRGDSNSPRGVQGFDVRHEGLVLFVGREGYYGCVTWSGYWEVQMVLQLTLHD
jgi:hypothetical protein